MIVDDVMLYTYERLHAMLNAEYLSRRFDMALVDHQS